MVGGIAISINPFLDASTHLYENCNEIRYHGCDYYLKVLGTSDCLEKVPKDVAARYMCLMAGPHQVQVKMFSDSYYTV